MRRRCIRGRARRVARIASRGGGIPASDATPARLRCVAWTAHGQTPKGSPGFAAAAPRAHTPAPRPGAASGRPRTPRPSSPREERGAAGACLGESEQTSAVRSSAAPLCSVGGQPPREWPREGGPVVCAPPAVGRDLDEGAVERPGRPLAAHDRFSLPRLEDPVKDAGLRPAVHPGVEGGQGPNRGGHPRPLPPCAATDKRAGSTERLERRTGPRGTGRWGAIRA